MDKIAAMNAYVKVVESTSFARAAEVLHTSAAYVTRMVQVLESDLGVKLLNRTTRRSKPTDAGLRYYERCVALLRDLDDMDADAQASRGSKSGVVRVSMPSLIAKSAVIPALPDFLASHPDIRLDISIADQHSDLIEEGLDCAVRVGAVSEPGLVAKSLGHYRTLTYASPDYIRVYGEPFTLDDLKDHIGVSYAMKSGRIRSWEFFEGNEIRSVALKSAILVNDTDTYVACGLAGLGLIQGSTFVLDAHVRAGRLTKVLRDYPLNPRPVSVVYVPNRTRPRRVDIFIDWLVDLYSIQLADQS
ncbi:LysR family transcriptional regulator [Paraburkholderia aromaticivorans]|uniref:LysR family transcriptional regulator n=1 Tax=Paraburkholderia aromaticivorans TaxID=2026199 RepID=A0A248VD47_9BURK|nr:LysR family transcriptional regulator [Paraburkholderia aromaticivorans]ASV96888.1 LysR family transcriptional regulator [Paraburkholderia aromaticivorans]